MINNTMIIAHESFEESVMVEDVKKHHMMSMMMPTLTDGQMKAKEIMTAVGNEIGLTYEEMNDSCFGTRFRFAMADAKLLGFLTSPAHGIHELTDTGRSVLDILEVFKANNSLHEVVEVFKGAYGAHTTHDDGFDILSELHQLEAKMFPKETKEPTETDILYAHIARLELRITKLESMLSNNGQGI